jgi:hypothetical protein
MIKERRMNKIKSVRYIKWLRGTHERGCNEIPVYNIGGRTHCRVIDEEIIW